MFCSNCGYELPEGVQFCSKCGTRIRNDDLVAVKEEEFEKNAPVSAKFENITVQNQFSERVNSELFADRRSQNKLFSVYADLITPVRRIEELTTIIEEKDKRVAYLKNEGNAESFLGIVLAIVVFVLAFIMQWIDGSPVAVFADWFMPIITEPVSQLLDTLWNTGGFLFQLLWFLLTFVFMLLSTLVTPFVLMLVFSVVWSFTMALILKKVQYEKNLRKAEEIQKELDELVQKREEVCLGAKDKLVYVPKKYRYSEAISYFVDLYNSSRVDTLKEAVNTYAHDKQEAEKLQQVMDKIDGVMGYLASIEERLY